MKKNGFTMVEVIVVVAIIAVLASIIMPKMTGARDKAKVEACKQNLRQINNAIELYANDNNGVRGPVSGTTYVYLNDSCYLVTEGYLRSAIKCPLGNTYYIYPSYTGGWCGTYNVPLNLALITCSNVRHPGYSAQCPYVWGGQVRDGH